MLSLQEGAPASNIKYVKRAYGFTLIELLVVILVIAILAAIAVVSYTSIQGRAREAAVQTELRNIGQSMQVIAFDKSITEADWTSALTNAGLHQSTRDSSKKVLYFAGVAISLRYLRCAL